MIIYIDFLLFISTKFWRIYFWIFIFVHVCVSMYYSYLPMCRIVTKYPLCNLGELQLLHPKFGTPVITHSPEDLPEIWDTRDCSSFLCVMSQGGQVSNWLISYTLAVCTQNLRHPHNCLAFFWVFVFISYFNTILLILYFN